MADCWHQSNFFSYKTNSRYTDLRINWFWMVISSNELARLQAIDFVIVVKLVKLAIPWDKTVTKVLDFSYHGPC